MLDKYLRRLPALLSPHKMKVFSSEERNFFGILVREDILPSEHRAELWLRATGAKTAMNDNIGYYSSLRSDCPNPAIGQVELDLKRTFPETSYYQDP